MRGAAVIHDDWAHTPRLMLEVVDHVPNIEPFTMVQRSGHC